MEEGRWKRARTEERPRFHPSALPLVCFACACAGPCLMNEGVRSPFAPWHLGALSTSKVHIALNGRRLAGMPGRKGGARRSPWEVTVCAQLAPSMSGVEGPSRGKVLTWPEFKQFHMACITCPLFLHFLPLADFEGKSRLTWQISPRSETRRGPSQTASSPSRPRGRETIVSTPTGIALWRRQLGRSPSPSLFVPSFSGSVLSTSEV